MTVTNPNRPNNDDREPLRLVGFDINNIVPASEEGVASVRFLLSRPPTEFEIAQARVRANAGFTAVALQQQSIGVVVEHVSVSKLGTWAERINESLVGIEQDGATAERQWMKTAEDTIRALQAIDFKQL